MKAEREKLETRNWKPRTSELPAGSPPYVLLPAVCSLPSSARWLPLVAFGLVFLTGCRLDMHVQPKYKPLARSTFFDDGRAARPAVPDTVARGHLQIDEHLFTGKVKGTWVNTFPSPITTDDLERGRERYNIFCTPCHGKLGDGRGMVVLRGFPPPPSYHMDRLRQAPVGQFFDVITNGYGKMYSYASRIPPEDRWRIIAYIRALQLSQQARIEDVPEGERRKLLETSR